MPKEKIYQVTVVLEVYGQNSKHEVNEFLEDALHVDGLFVQSQSVPKHLKLHALSNQPKET